MIYNFESENVPKEKVGGKAFNLAHLDSIHDINVPKWICLSTDVFYKFLGNKKSEYENLLIDYKDENREKIIELIKSTNFSNELKNQIKEQMRKYFKDNIELAVRSSATDEDSSNYSFAGMLESYLNVKNDENIYEYIKKCYISCFSERIMEYRKKYALINKDISVAVIIQEMVDADYAGVIFTINPNTNNPDEIKISIVKGLGEKLVSGMENSNDYVIDIFNSIVKKDSVELYELDEKTIIDLAKKARIIEDSYELKRGQDIEFAIKNNEIFILQCRVITTYDFVDKRKYRTILDNSNIIESYSGVTTPLTYTFAREVYGKIYHQTLRNFFIKEDVIEKITDDLNNMLYFYENKIYYKLNSWYKMTSLYPGYEKNKEYMENMMGVKTPLKETTKQANNRLIKIYIRFIYKMLRMKKDSKLFLEKFNKVTSPYNNNTFENKSNKELVKIYNDLEEEILNDFTTPIANDMGAMVFYGMLTDSMKKHKFKDYEGIISSIMTKQGNVESAKQTSDLIDIIIKIKEDEILKNKFLNNDININSNEPIINDIKDYLLKFGSRSMEELKLETVTMNENPDFLFKTINNYLKIDNIESINNEEENRTEKNNREKEVYKYYNIISKIYLNKLIKITKYFIRNRECLRLRRTYIYAIVRNIFLRIGKNFENDKIIENYRDIFFMEKDEIFNIISNDNIAHSNLKSIIEKRKKEYENNKEKKTYERMYFYGDITPENMLPIYNEQETTTNSNSNIIKGVAGGGQVVEGIVKYVQEPSDVDINGYILMAKRTDPGWTILFPMAKAIIIERGSVLSHSAVIAREMGITLVVGVRGLTEKVKDGAKVRVDGINGTIEILGEENEG